MVNCFAWGCNTTECSGKALFAFPKDNYLRKQWLIAMNRNKADLDRSKAPKLCEDHFRDESFTKIRSIAKVLGCRLNLKQGSIPCRSLFKRTLSSSNDNNVEKKQRTSLAYYKRQNIEVRH